MTDLGAKDENGETARKRADELKIEGNNAVKAGRFEDAFERYTFALSYCSTKEQSGIIRLNRSLVNIQLRKYEDAYQDTLHEKSDTRRMEKLYRSSLAQHGMERYWESYEKVQTLVQNYPGNVEARRLLSSLEQRLREQTHGDYDYTAMYEAARKPFETSHFATYIGPVELKTSSITDGGQGMFVTKAVQAGELLICERAFCHSPLSKQGEFLGKLEEKLRRRPQLIPTFASLYRPKNAPAIRADGSPIVDIVTMKQRLHLNAVNCPPSSLWSQMDDNANEAAARDKRFSYIKTPRFPLQASGLWIRASGLNHSCLHTVSTTHIGQMMIIRTTRDLPAGSELFCWYSMPQEHECNATYVSRWGFRCRCAICSDKKRTPKAAHLARLEESRNLILAAQPKEKPAPKQQTLQAMEDIVSKMERTYFRPPDRVPRLTVYRAYLDIAHRHLHQDPEKAIVAIANFFAALGYVIGGLHHNSPSPPAVVKVKVKVRKWGPAFPWVMQAWYDLHDACRRVRPHLCAGVEKCARVSYRIIKGEDETFEKELSREGEHRDRERRMMGPGWADVPGWGFRMLW